jgi:hypothetical protein
VSLQTEYAELLPCRCVGESLPADAGDFVPGLEPHPQPVSDVVVHGSVGSADTAETEVPAPAWRQRVQVAHHFLHAAGCTTPVGCFTTRWRCQDTCAAALILLQQLGRWRGRSLASWHWQKLVGGMERRKDGGGWIVTGGWNRRKQSATDHQTPNVLAGG